MMSNNNIFKTFILTILFFIISTYSHSNILDFSKDAKNISNYFSGSVAFNNFEYDVSKKYFDKFSNSEKENNKFSSTFIQSLIYLQKYNEAYSFSKSLDKKGNASFENKLFLGLHEFKNKNYTLAKLHFSKLDSNVENPLIFEPLKISLINWSEILISNNIKDIDKIKLMPDSFGSFKAIQEVFAYCYFDNSDLDKKFSKIILDESGKFYRYNFFFANYLIKKDREEEARSIIDLTID